MNDDLRELVTPPEQPQWSFRQKATYWIIFLAGTTLATWIIATVATAVFDTLWPQ